MVFQKAINEIKEAKSPLALNLRNCGIKADGAWLLADAIKEANASLEINLSDNSIGAYGAELLAEAIKEVQAPLTLNLYGNNIGDIGVASLAYAITKVRVSLELNLGNNGIGVVGIELLSSAIKQAQVPITLGLYDNNMGDVGVRLLTDAIKGAQVPLSLNLGVNNIREAGLVLLVDVIKQARVPFNLNLCANAIGDSGVELLVDAIRCAQAPLILGLGYNDIGDAGAGLLADAIKEARVSLTLLLSYNNIGDAGAGLLADAIKKARVPLTLCLSHNNREDVATGGDYAGLLANAIKEAQVPLALNLAHNNIKADGVKLIADAIKEAQAPLTLGLCNNNIGDVGAGLLAEAIRCARAPLSLDFRSNNIGADGNELLDNAIKDNFVIDAGRNPSKFLARIEFGLSRRMLEQKMACPFVVARLIQDYIGSSDLAWAEVAAIRVIEGASHENKYSSINYELLTAAYFNTRSAAQPLAEVAAEPLYTNESIQKRRNHISSALSTHDGGNDSGGNVDIAQVDELSQSSSYSAMPPDGGSGGSHSAELSYKEETILDYPSSNMQPINYEHKQALQVGNDNGNTYAAENLLMTLFAWIKDLSAELRYKILSSFSMQQVLEVLETTTHNGSLITGYLSCESIKEIFATEYQNYYGQDDSTCNQTGCAQTTQQNYPIFVDNDGEMISTLDASNLFGDIRHIASM